jgi:hypothetical protein
MPNPASDAARNHDPHDAPSTTPKPNTTTARTTTNPTTTRRHDADSTTTEHQDQIDKPKDQGKNDEQSTNRAGISMVRVAAGSPVGDGNTVPGTPVHAVAGGRHAA